MEPIVSVLIPAYNHEKYVQDTIQSIINQSYKNIELIIVNDGSSDSTLGKIAELKEKCEERFVRFVLLSQENQGTCATMNRLLEHAQGEFVYFIASDDAASPDAITELQSCLSSNSSCALAVGENLIMDSESKPCYWDSQRNCVYDLSQAVFTSFSDFLIKITPHVDFLSDDFGSYESILIANYIPNGQLIRKSIFDKIGYFKKEAPLEDYYLMLQIAKYSNMKYVQKPLFYYRWHGCNAILNDERIKDFDMKTRIYEIETVLKSGNKELMRTMQKFLHSLK